MLQHFHILTLTHRNAKLKEIGELVAAFEGEGRLPRAPFGLQERGLVEEVFYAATCNRILLLFTTNREVDEAFKRALLSEPVPALARLRHLCGLRAIKHLYEVAGSIDSLVVGERQILGQLRERVRSGAASGASSVTTCASYATRPYWPAKDIYANTRIGEKSVSVVSLSMQQLQRHTPSRKARILMIGAGQTNVLVTKFLKKQGYTDVTIANRTLQRAEQLAAGFEHGRALGLDDLVDYQDGFDVTVCLHRRSPGNRDDHPVLLPTRRGARRREDRGGSRRTGRRSRGDRQALPLHLHRH